jgi:hypothetical protein
MHGRQSGPRAVINELAEADCEQEVTENGVVQASEQQRTGHRIREWNEESADEAKPYGQPVPENDVKKSEGHCTGEDHPSPVAEKRLLAMKEKRAVQQFLRVNGKQWIGTKNEQWNNHKNGGEFECEKQLSDYGLIAG